MRYTFLVFLIIACVRTAYAQGYDACDNVIEKGEPMSAFFGMEYSIFVFSTAKKFCDVQLPPISRMLLRDLEKDGCGPHTKIYEEVKNLLAKIEPLSLEEMMTIDEPNNQLTHVQAVEHARVLVESAGGCDFIAKKLADAYRN